MNKKYECVICGCSIDEERVTSHGERRFISCPNCGLYTLSLESTIRRNGEYCHDYGAVFDAKKLAAYLYYHKKERRCAFIGSESAFEQYKKSKPESKAFLVTSEAVDNWYPKTFEERVNCILLQWAKKSKFIGDSVKIDIEEFNSFFFLCNVPKSDDWRIEVKFLLCYLDSEGILEYPIFNDKYGDTKVLEARGNAALTLSAKGWAKVYDLQKTQANSKTAFVAMKFGAETEELRQMIKKGIEDAGYVPRIMDEIEHNHQIMPEMLHEIKNSRFVVAELSHHNNGAYYESGFAYGLGKEVIHICNEDALKADLHFDVAQINTVTYKNNSEIPEKLFKRIQATII